jgi:Flp pilus assembly protein TadD
LHVESVAWVSERKDVLSTFFWLLTMWAYVRFVRRPGVAGYLLVVVFLALGLMSKPMLVTLPFVLLLLDYWPLNRLNPRRPKAGLFIEKIPLFAMVLASCIVTYISQQKGGAVLPMELHDFPVRLANASISYLQYIIKMIWPARLAIVYPYPGPNVSFFLAIISTVFLLVITIFIFRFAANHRYLVTGWLWYLGTLVPVIGLVQVGDQAMADRYTYVTLTGLFIIITWGLPDLLAKWRYKKIVLTLSALLIVLAMSIGTHFQLRYWRNNLTLFQHTLDVTKDNYIAHLCMATSMREQGKVDETIYHCSEAIRIKPNSREAHNRLGDTLRDAGKPDEAAREYQKSLQIKPDDPNVLNALGITLGRQDKSDEAVKYLTEALRIKPDFAAAHTNLGYALAIQGDFNEAALHFVEAIRLDPGSAKAHYHFGRILVQRGETDEAIVHFNQAIRIDPNYTAARESLDLVLAEKQKLQGTENTKK